MPTTTPPPHGPGNGASPAGATTTGALPRFVRVLQRRADGLVSFEFAIGWPELSVELLLPRAAFDTFCTQNAVQFLTEASGDDHNDQETTA